MEVVSRKGKYIGYVEPASEKGFWFATNTEGQSWLIYTKKEAIKWLKTSK